MGFALNIIFLCVLVIGIISGVRKGFIRSAAKFIGRILAICIAGVLGSAVASWLFFTFFRDPFLERITDMLRNASAGLGAESVMAELPDFLVRALEAKGVTTPKLSAMIQGQQTEAARVIVNALEPIIISILKVMCVIVIFMLLMIVVRIVTDVLASMFELPFLGFVDGLLGAVFGLISAVLLLWIVLALISIFMPMTSETMQELLMGYIKESSIMDFMYNMNPFKVLVG